MKPAYKKVVEFVKREWFLIVVTCAIAIIVLIFEFL
jgi:hypothetical protein